MTGGGANARLDNFTRVSVWTPRGREHKRSLTGQDKGQRAEVAAFIRSVQRGEPMPITLDSLGRDDQGHLAGRGLGQGGAAVSRGSAGTSGGCAGCRLERLTHRARDCARQKKWATRRRASKDPAHRPWRGCLHELRGPVGLHEVARDPVPTRVRATVQGRRRPDPRPAPGRCSASFATTSPTRTGSVTRSPGGRRPATSCAFSVDQRDESVTGNVKQVWELSRHHHLTQLAAAYWVTGDEQYAEAVDRQLRSWWLQEPVPVRHPLDERDRARGPPHLLGLDPPTARRVAQGAGPLRAQRGLPPAGAVAPGVPDGVPQRGVVGEQPCRRRGRRAAGGGVRPAVVRGE